MTFFPHFSPICIQLNAAVHVYQTLLDDCELRDNKVGKTIFTQQRERMLPVLSKFFRF